MTQLFLLGLFLAALYFGVVWAICVKVRNYGFLDVAWSYGVAILAPLYAWLAPGYGVRRGLLTALGVAWSLRLGTYILLRVLKHHPQEDPRYEKLRARWNGPGMFLLFFEVQAVTVAIFSLPFLFSFFNTRPQLTSLEIAASVLALVALLGETAADLQIQAFKKNTENRERVCQTGLWRYSRHPNYFFESLTWWAFFLFALSSSWGWTTIACPLLMLYFLFRVTGIPLTEEYSLKSKGDAYRAYQRTTSAFVPWPPKSSAL